MQSCQLIWGRKISGQGVALILARMAWNLKSVSVGLKVYGRWVGFAHIKSETGERIDARNSGTRDILAPTLGISPLAVVTPVLCFVPPWLHSASSGFRRQHARLCCTSVCSLIVVIVQVVKIWIECFRFWRVLGFQNLQCGFNVVEDFRNWGFLDSNFSI